MKISYRHLEVFHAVMRSGSVTAAAKSLHVSQPAVSEVLKHAELQMKIRLFDRIGGRLVPTPEANALFPDVAAVFGRIDAVERQIQDLAGGRLGNLSLAAAFPIANGYLTKAVAAFLTTRPKIRVALQSITSPQVAERVAIGEAELGLAYNIDALSPAVESEVLVHSMVACVVPESHPLAKMDEVDVRELAPYSIITYLPQTVLRAHVDRALADAGIAPNVNVQVSLSLTGMMMAYHGAGIALVEPFLLTSLPFPGLVARPLRPRIELNTLLLRARDVPRSRVANEFVIELKKTIRASQHELVQNFGTAFTAE
jgi:DNA-binding transcriptional LysR family regulator